uniref:Uncharacterized protein n=1 Tax=Anguilla anguilla TaxID=7936 RepID=A0A0E9S655_ANGAN
MALIHPRKQIYASQGNRRPKANVRSAAHSLCNVLRICTM